MSSGHTLLLPGGINLKHSQVSAAVFAAIASSQAQHAAAQQAAPGAGGLEEVVVTAQRRSESIQNVPITVQALTSETLDNLKVTTIDEYVRFLPNVQAASSGPTHGNFSIRGLSIGAAVLQGGGTVGQWPTVGLYLDDQTVQMPGRNLDVYAADLDRIEVLEGPQGTLFGAGAQAGVVRYITTKPKLGVTEGYFRGGYATTAGGADSSNVQGALNLPLSDRIAVRITAYNDSRGGYIDNVPSTFTRRSTDTSFATLTGGRVPTDSVVIDNFKIARDNINDVTYKGARAGLLFQINDDWNVLVSQSFQDITSGGVFYEMPFGSDCPDPRNERTCTTGGPLNAAVRGKPLGDYQVTLFNDSITTDNFKNTALTINGKVGALDLVYSGSRLTRDNFIQGDYTNYARGLYGAYYQCTGYSGASVDKCYSPSSIWKDTIKNINTQHEIRLSTPSDWKISAVGGLFYENRKVNDDTEWLYKTVPECTVGGPQACFFALDPVNTTKFANASFNNTARRNSATGFFNDFKRTYEQKAAFLSVDWKATDTLTLTVGTRYFKGDNQMLGGNVGSFFCKQYGTGVSTRTGICATPFGTNLNNQAVNSFTDKGFRSRVNVSWKAMDKVLLYATWSEGFRPGGFNRGSSQVLRAVDRSTGVARRGAFNQFQLPLTFESDDLVNYEVGWKTTLLNNRVQFNGSIYKVSWKNAQSGIFAPQAGFGNLTVSVNGPDYETKGVSMSLTARVTDGLTVDASAAYNKAELTNNPQFFNNVTGTPTFGQAITEAWVGSAASGRAVNVTNVFGVPGDPAANAPKLQGNIRARYEWSANSFDYYTQVGVAHSGERFSAANRLQTFRLKSYTDVGLSAGVAKDQWTLEGVITNLTNRHNAEYASSSQFVETRNPPRPRTFAVQIGYRFD
jgi:iron complex outermembrane receptor protein